MNHPTCQRIETGTPSYLDCGDQGHGRDPLGMTLSERAADTTPPVVRSLANKLVQQKLSKLGLARVNRDMARETELTGEVPRLFDNARTTTCSGETCSRIRIFRRNRQLFRGGNCYDLEDGRDQRPHEGQDLAAQQAGQGHEAMRHAASAQLEQGIGSRVYYRLARPVRLE